MAIKKNANKNIKSVKKKGSTFNTDIEYFKYFKILPIEETFKYVFICAIYFEKMHGKPRVHIYNTRIAETNPLFVPKIVNRFTERLNDYLLPKLWNQIPSK